MLSTRPVKNSSVKGNAPGASWSKARSPHAIGMMPSVSSMMDSRLLVSLMSARKFGAVSLICSVFWNTDSKKLRVFIFSSSAHIWALQFRVLRKLESVSKNLMILTSNPTSTCEQSG